MTATMTAVAVAVWLALQVPIGIAIGCYIRRAQAPAPARPCIRKGDRPRSKRRPFAECAPPAALLRG
ncbi:MAG TPA: hypothetical protein VHA35_03120 [Dongiaceae bacterium]|jgi:hypothetical protein|nr:hypothetical protein [Dongiaceae bacterium]